MHLGVRSESAEIPDQVAFGWNVADLDIGDPGTEDPCDMTKKVEPRGGGRWVTRYPRGTPPLSLDPPMGFVSRGSVDRGTGQVRGRG
jgi:hypothetical protein